MFRFFLVFFFSFSALASSDRQFAHFGDRERRELNTPNLVTSEYQSDRLTYQYLNSWNLFWENEDNVFQYTAGSLGPSRFATHGRGKMETSITDSWKFRFYYFEAGSLTEAREAIIFEFDYKLFSFWNIYLYGEPDTFKSEDDVGLASQWKLTDSQTFKVFYTWVDFSHNKRTEDLSRYDKKPGSGGFIWNYFGDNRNFTQLFFRHDQATQQIFQSGRIYQFSGTELKLTDYTKLSDSNNYLSSEILFRSGSEGDTQNTNLVDNYFELKQVDGLLQVANDFSRIHLYGIRAIYTQWESASGQVIHNDLLPHIWGRVARYVDGERIHQIDLGYEMTWHRGRGLAALRSDLDGNDRSEHRLNFKYNFIASQKTYINFLLTFDMDELGTGETWEGGAMQFHTRF